MDNGQLIRYSAPTKFDCAEYGTLWIQILDDCKEMYIQVHKDENAPHWIPIGAFLEKALHAKLFEEGFLEECLKTFNP